MAPADVEGSTQCEASTHSSGRARLALGLVAALTLVSLAVAPQAGAFIYWPGFDTDTIGRSDLGGIAPDQSFISDANGPFGIAIDDAHVYWANCDGTTLGRANLDGTSPNQSFVGSIAVPCGVGVDTTHVYWANCGSPGSIGRADLDGTDPDYDFITSRTSRAGTWP